MKTGVLVAVGVARRKEGCEAGFHHGISQPEKSFFDKRGRHANDGRRRVGGPIYQQGTHGTNERMIDWLWS